MAAVEKKTVKIFSKEEIKKAESVDIYEFLGAHGSGELKGGGRYPKYYIKGHKSIVVDRKKNYFYHNGQHKGNNIIRLLMDYEGYNFRQSVSFLLGEEFEQHQGYDEEAEEQEEFKYPYKHEKTTERVKKYLVDERGIDREIVDYLIENGYVYQDKQYKSVVFAWRENGLANGEIVGATSQGTIIDHERYGKRGTAKFIAKNSKRNYGFNITLGNPEAYYFFESSIDLLSFWSTHKELTNCRLMSMEGLKKNSLIQYIQETYQNFNQLPKDGIFYGVDNDSAGHRLYDYAYHYLNIAKKKAGKATPNVNMIPFNNQISKEHFDLYQELSQEFPEATWEMLATIHKVETNMSNDNKIANEYDIQSALAISDKSEEKIGPIDVRAALTKIAATIQEKHLTPETLIRLYPDEKWNSTDQLFVNHKFERVYALYSEKNYEVVETVQMIGTIM
ncbi:DUF3991 domain-containing protein [Enterococcus rivorum]|uniref:DUF3991 domain-containing protein n=1 Tax=Enterococcus rivorum TaxID=762845 RepID=UPI00362DEC60